jgi:hypothetical protein
MLNNSFIQNAFNMKIKFFTEMLNINAFDNFTLWITPETVQNYNEISSNIEEILASVYIYSNVFLIDTELNTHYIKVVQINYTNKNITFLSEKPLNINIGTLYLNEKKIISGGYNKPVDILNIKEFAQQKNNNTLRFGVDITVSKPKFYKVYKYTIKYRFDFGDFQELEIINKNIDFKSNDRIIVELNIPNIHFNNFYYKVSAHYNYASINDVSFYSNLQKIKKQDIHDIQ